MKQGNLEEILESHGLDEEEIDRLVANWTQQANVKGMDPEKPEMLIYDIETTPLKFWGFQTGNQFLSHSSLDKACNRYDVICVTYCFNDGKPAQGIHWGHGDGGSAIVLKNFDKIIKSAQDRNCIIIGKNNKRFDDKHLNTHRWLNNEAPMPDWIKYTDDLESQLRKYFYLPSYSLDYVSTIKGLGGKIKMELQDWVNIVNYKMAKVLITKIGKVAVKKISKNIFGYELDDVLQKGYTSLEQMVSYGKKDAEDTREIILDVSSHCEFKSNKLQYRNQLRCKDPLCGSSNIHKNGSRVVNGLLYQKFQCAAHNGYAGRALVKADGSYGKLT